MINLTEAIKHCKDKAKELKEEVERKDLKYGKSNNPIDLKVAADCLECAGEHEQLAGWLEELAERRGADRWIPVSERLPDKEGWYLVDRKERTFSIQYFFFGLADHKPYWSGECKVYYWRPLPPKPEESEDK